MKDNAKLEMAMLEIAQSIPTVIHGITIQNHVTSALIGFIKMVMANARKLAIIAMVLTQ